MASVKASDIPEIQQFMGEFWLSIKKLYGVELTDEYSAEVHECLDELTNKYPDPLCKELTLTFYSYLESEQRRMFRERRGESSNEQQVKT